MPDTTAAIDIAEALARALAGAAAGWRFTVTSSAGLSMGIDHWDLGGAYAPPKKAQVVDGSVFIVWPDSSVSRGRVDANSPGRLTQLIAAWKSTSFRDDEAAYIAPVAEPAEVDLTDPRVANVALSDPRPAFDTLAAVSRAAKAAGVTTLDAGVRCSAGDTVTAASSGLWVHFSHTALGCSWVLDNAFGMVRPGRAIEVWKGVEPLVDSTAQMLAASRHRVSLASGSMKVILWPAVVDDLLKHYLYHNFSGEAAAEGRSRFSIEDFRRGRGAFRHDVTIELDTTVPMGPGSYPCTAEGIPGGRVKLVDGGSLVTPLLNLKYSRRTGMMATPLPVAGMSPGHAGLKLHMGQGDPPAFDSVMRSTERALLVTSVLGMHTQDPVSGNFSLAASDAILIEDGEFAGASKVVISGNLFDVMNAAVTTASSHPVFATPALTIICRVES
jgi:PmbA protein